MSIAELLKGKSKKEPARFGLLVPQVIEAIPNLRIKDGPGKPIHDMAARHEQLKEQKKQVFEKLKDCTAPGPFGQPLPKFDTASDVQSLLAGTDVSELVEPVQESHYASLMRQFRALERAIPETEREKIRLCEEITQAQLETVRPVAQEIIGQTLEAAEVFLECLKTQEQFFDLLRVKGFYSQAIPPSFKLWPQECGLLAGDVHRPSLSHYIKTRRESIGLDIKQEKR